MIAFGMPFQVFGAGASMFIRADGSPGYAMASTLFGAILNVILDPVFIFGLDMGLTGDALATVIGQIISAGIALVYFRNFRSVKHDRILKPAGVFPASSYPGLSNDMGIEWRFVHRTCFRYFSNASMREYNIQSLEKDWEFTVTGTFSHRK